jgi:hypothetical protein
MKKQTSYLPETDPNIVKDITSRKEFALFTKSLEAINFAHNFQLKNRNNNIIPKFVIADNIPDSHYLKLRSYQMLIANYFNPNTPYTRLLLKWATGHGKTIGAISIAMDFIKYYRLSESMADNIGSVFIIGFTKNIFKNELLHYPEFGFVTREELKEISIMKNNIENGITSEIEKLHYKRTILRRRLGSRQRNGFFRFIGYKELANHLFGFYEYGKSDSEIDDMMNLIKEWLKLPVDEFRQKLDSHEIKINYTLLNEFGNSLIICDEIHNVYNTIEKNNWGTALQTILNYHDTCRSLFLSATPLNNSPTEIVDLLNLLLPRKFYTHLDKHDFFDKDSEGINIIKPSKELEISDYLKGRVSFVQEQNPKFIASKKIVGHVIPGIDYLKFIRCEMQALQLNTYNAMILDHVEGVWQDSHYLMDFAVPSPDLPTSNVLSQKDKNKSSDQKNQNKSSTSKSSMSKSSMSKSSDQKDQNKSTDQNLGLYKQKDIDKIKTASLEWRNKHGINYNVDSSTITGPILNEKNIAQISNKYFMMIKKFMELLANDKAKTFVYHNYIHVSGVLFIKEIFLQNGIIGENDNSTDNTLCICGKIRKEHKAEQLDQLNIKNVGRDVHFFKPIRFGIIHSELDHKQRSTTLEKFNSTNNIYGSNMMILLGSRIMQESHSINSVRNIFIMSIPDNIPTLIQIIGRAIRLNSHKLLPMDKRHVDIHIFVSSMPKLKALSYEEERYQNKIKTYKVIQMLEKIMHESAIDAYFNYDTIWSDIASKKKTSISEQKKTAIGEQKKTSTSEQKKTSIGEQKKPAIGEQKKTSIGEQKKTSTDDYELDILPYQLEKFKPGELNLSTFNTYYAKKAVEYYTYMIKRLFIETSSVWTYTDLYEAIRRPPFMVTIDTNLITHEHFNIALNVILYNEIDEYIEPAILSNRDTLLNPNLMDKLHDLEDKVLISDNYKYIVVHRNNMYCMVPLINNIVNTEPEILFRVIDKVQDRYIDIGEYLSYDASEDYKSKQLKFINKWKYTNILGLEQSLSDFGLNFHIQFIEKIISYIFNIWTSSDQKKDENHAFYLRMLYLYDLQNLVIWAHVVDSDLEKLYSKYVTPVSLKSPDEISSSTTTTAATTKSVADTHSGSINRLITALTKSRIEWMSEGMIKEYENNLHATNKLFDNIYKKKSHPKVKANMLPVGHYIDTTARFYDPNTGWFNHIFKTQKFKENDVIIGYDQRSDTSISTKFKIRSPIHKIKNVSDARLVGKGGLCVSKSKVYLRDIAKQLGIVIDNISHTEDFCANIRSRLIYLELKERKKNSNIKYFYSILENME